MSCQIVWIKLISVIIIHYHTPDISRHIVWKLCHNWTMSGNLNLLQLFKAIVDFIHYADTLSNVCLPRLMMKCSQTMLRWYYQLNADLLCVNRKCITLYKCCGMAIDGTCSKGSLDHSRTWSLHSPDLTLVDFYLWRYISTQCTKLLLEIISILGLSMKYYHETSPLHKTSYSRYDSDFNDAQVPDVSK